MIRDIEPGDGVFCTTFKNTHGYKQGGGDWIELTFKAPKGKRFVMLFLGAEPDDGSDPVDLNQRL